MHPTVNDLLSPLTLDAHLDEGRLSEVDQLEIYARMFHRAHYGGMEDDRTGLASWALDRATAIVNEDFVEQADGNFLLVDLDTRVGVRMLRHYIWIAQGVGNKDLADRFLAEMSPEVRTLAMSHVHLGHPTT